MAPGELDALRFAQLAAEGDAALAAGDADTATSRFDQALGLKPGQRVVTKGAFLLKTEIMKGAIGAGCCE